MKKIPSLPSAVRDDLIDWEYDEYGTQLRDNLPIDDDIPFMIIHNILSLVQEYWGLFDEGCVSRPVTGYEFV